jgi:hypothetical protein
MASPPPDREPVHIDTTVAHTARVYDYLLGGSDNFAVDRQVAEHAFDAYPGGIDGARADARANRDYLRRAVRYLVHEAGIRQLLDIGTGIPNADNTHAVAHHEASDARVVYVDNDPLVLAHAHAILRGQPPEATAYVHGDFREPEAILADAAATLDFDVPVAVVVTGVLHVIPDADDPYGRVATLMAAVPSGSYLVLSHITADLHDPAMATVTARLEETMRTTNPPALRSLDEVARFFATLELVEPGIVPAQQWRPECGTAPVPDRPTPLYAAVGRKP